ncbi:zinc finger protein 808-like isoform X3 [Pararge aegeria]|nr:zinc finger protein 808-like isoform X3 [Pararge aegeria]
MNLICDRNITSKVCTECARRLTNCHKFKDKTVRTYKLLLKLYEKHGTLTLQDVMEISRVVYELKSNLVKHIIEPDHCDLHLKEDFDEDMNIEEEVYPEHTNIDNGSMLDSEVKSKTSDGVNVGENNISISLDDNIYNDAQIKKNETNNDVIMESDTFADNGKEDIVSDHLEDFLTDDSDNKAEFLNNDDINDDGYSDVEYLDDDVEHVIQSLNPGMNNNRMTNIKTKNIQNVDETISKSPEKIIIKQHTYVETKNQENSEIKNDDRSRTPRSQENSKINNIQDSVDLADEDTYTDFECLEDEIEDAINNYTDGNGQTMNTYESYVKFVNENIKKACVTNALAIAATSNNGNENEVILHTMNKVNPGNFVLVRTSAPDIVNEEVINEEEFNEKHAKKNKEVGYNEKKKKLAKHENKNDHEINRIKPGHSGSRPDTYGNQSLVKLGNGATDKTDRMKSNSKQNSKKSLAKRKDSDKDAKLHPQFEMGTNQKEDSKEDEKLKIFKVEKLTLEEQLSLIEERKETDNYKNSPYQCNICYKGFLAENTFDEHLFKHTDKCGLFECAICRIRFKSKRILGKHFQMTHVTRYSCTKCPFVSTLRNSAWMHERWHAGVKYKCKYCGKEYLRNSTYMLHVRVKHPSDCACNRCGFSFVGEKGLKLHMQIKHHGENLQKLEGPTCEDCDIRFASDTAYEQHMKVSPKHATANQLKRNSAPKDKNYRWPKQLPALRAHFKRTECEQCGVVLEGARNYDYHFRRHHPDKNRTNYSKRNVMCEQCGRVFKSASDLRSHMPYHSGQKQFKCDICDKRFALKVNLVTHAATHTEQRFECEVCGKLLTKKSNLKTHMAIHQDSRPMHACGLCDKTFTTRHGRQEHVTHVHNNVPYKLRLRPARNTGAKRKITRKASVSVH